MFYKEDYWITTLVKPNWALLRKWWGLNNTTQLIYPAAKPQNSAYYMQQYAGKGLQYAITRAAKRTSPAKCVNRFTIKKQSYNKTAYTRMRSHTCFWTINVFWQTDTVLNTRPNKTMRKSYTWIVSWTHVSDHGIILKYHKNVNENSLEFC